MNLKNATFFAIIGVLLSFAVEIIIVFSISEYNPISPSLSMLSEVSYIIRAITLVFFFTVIYRSQK
jgi:hypothetical protein